MFRALFSGLLGSNVKTVSPREVMDMMTGGEKVTVIDVRSADEFNGGHVPQARLIPLPVLGKRLKETPKDRPVVVTCASGMRSRMASEQLMEQGYENVYNMKGGMMAWRRAGLAMK